MTPFDNRANKAPVFVVIEDNAIVAMDLAEILAEWNPEAVVHTFRTADNVVDRINSCAHITATFIHMRMSQIIADGIEDAVISKDGQIILVGNDSLISGAEQRGWQTLAQPYSTEIVHSIVRMIDVSQPRGPH